MQGRFHFYEGYTPKGRSASRTCPSRRQKYRADNAAGGLNNSYTQGALVVISDHLNLMGVNPLVGRNDARFGVRFPDMTAVYDHEYQDIAVTEAHAMNLELRRGIYAALSGPSYETPAEIRMLRPRADAVGMAPSPSLVARQMGCVPPSFLTNLAAGTTAILNHTKSSRPASACAPPSRPCAEGETEIK